MQEACISYAVKRIKYSFTVLLWSVFTVLSIEHNTWIELAVGLDESRRPKDGKHKDIPDGKAIWLETTQTLGMLYSIVAEQLVDGTFLWCCRCVNGQVALSSGSEEPRNALLAFLPAVGPM